MKHIVFSVIVMFAATAWAQAPKEPAKEPVKEPAKAEAMKPVAEPARQAGSGPKIPNPRRWSEDARHCLELPTNTEIIKCAEEFL